MGFSFLLLIAASTIAFALLLGCLTGRVADRRLRLALPPVLALIIAGMAITSGAGTPLAVLLAIGIVAAAGTVTPLPLIDGVVSGRLRMFAALCSSIASAPFLIALLVNPEQLPGGPAPLLADRLPIIGGIFDGVIGALPPGTPTFDLAFSIFLWVGLYLEYMLVAAVVYLVLRTVASRHLDRRPE